VSGEVSHNNNMTLRANVAPRLQARFTACRPGDACALPLKRCLGCAGLWCAVCSRTALQVVLQEHQAVAYWGGEGELRLINSYGEVFEANVGEVESDMLPQLDGPKVWRRCAGHVPRGAPLFAEMELPVTRLELTRGGSWRAQLDTDASIELGRGTGDEVAARVRRFPAHPGAQVSSRGMSAAPTPSSRQICGTKTATPFACGA
jgi:cell division protein FtsQ